MQNNLSQPLLEQKNNRLQAALTALTGANSENESAKALLQLTEAARLDNSQAQYAIGIYYIKQILFHNMIQLNEPVVASKQRLGIDYLEKAAANYHPLALLTLGTLCHSGNIVVKDDSKAVDYFHKAAEKGDVKAMAYLAEWYTQGNIVEADYNQALFFLSKMAHHGYAFDLDNAVCCFAGGEFRHLVNPDYQSARAYYAKAKAYLDSQFGMQSIGDRSSSQQPQSGYNNHQEMTGPTDEFSPLLNDRWDESNTEVIAKACGSYIKDSPSTIDPYQVHNIELSNNGADLSNRPNAGALDSDYISTALQENCLEDLDKAQSSQSDSHLSSANDRTFKEQLLNVSTGTQSICQNDVDHSGPLQCDEHLLSANFHSFWGSPSEPEPNESFEKSFN